MNSFQFSIFRFLFLCFIRTKSDRLRINKRNKQGPPGLTKRGKVLDDDFRFRQVLPVLLTQRIAYQGHKATTRIKKQGISNTTSNTTFNRKFICQILETSCKRSVNHLSIKIQLQMFILHEPNDQKR